MKPIRTPFTATPPHGSAETALDAERQLALEYLADAWTAAEGDGVEPEALAHAALFAALATLVQEHGEAGAAELVAGLSLRIEHGEYSLDKTLQ